MESSWFIADEGSTVVAGCVGSSPSESGASTSKAFVAGSSSTSMSVVTKAPPWLPTSEGVVAGRAAETSGAAEGVVAGRAAETSGAAEGVVAGRAAETSGAAEGVVAGRAAETSGAA